MKYNKIIIGINIIALILFSGCNGDISYTYDNLEEDQEKCLEECIKEVGIFGEEYTIACDIGCIKMSRELLMRFK